MPFSFVLVVQTHFLMEKCVRVFFTIYTVTQYPTWYLVPGTWYALLAKHRSMNGAKLTRLLLIVPTIPYLWYGLLQQCTYSATNVPVNGAWAVGGAKLVPVPRTSMIYYTFSMQMQQKTKVTGFFAAGWFGFGRGLRFLGVADGRCSHAPPPLPPPPHSRCAVVRYLDLSS